MRVLGEMNSLTDGNHGLVKSVGPGGGDGGQQEGEILSDVNPRRVECSQEFTADPGRCSRWLDRA
jgi:hypothetical protein